MSQLCFSSMVELLKKNFLPNNTNIGVAKELLLDKIIEIYKIYDKNGQFVDLNSSKISKLMNQTMEIPDQIQSTVNDEKYYNDFLDYVSSEISPYIKSNLLYDFYYDLNNIISSDSTISPKKKEEFEQLYKSDTNKFLTTVILYAISKTNLPQVSNMTLEEHILLDEQNFRCANCNEYLIKNKKRKNTGGRKPNFILLTFPSDNIKSYDLLFCKECGEEFENIDDLTSDELKEFERKKIEFIKRTEIKQKLDSITIQSDLKEIITKLNSVNFSNDSTLSLQPLTIENKIPSTENVLLFKIRNDVIGYYNIVKQMFQELESFTAIAKEINYSFSILNEQGLNHQEIYDSLTDHIIRCTGLNSNKRLSCEIIVSFFIQNCEVYNEITE